MSFLFPPAPKFVAGGFKALLEEKPASISMAISPRKSFYTYQAVALANSLAYLHANREARLMVVLADLEFDMQRGSNFLPYSRNPDSIATSHLISGLLNEVPSIDASFEGRIYVRRFSEWLALDKGLLSHTLRLFDKPRAREAKHLISGKTGRVSRLPAAPICPSCDHASSAFGTISPAGDALSSVCNNKECSNFGETFSVPVQTPGSFCLFYFFDSLSDGYKDPAFGRADIHVLGIDPGRKWGNRIETSEVIGRLTALFTNDGYCPKYYGAMRLEEQVPIKRKSVFGKFHSERGITALGAMSHLMNTVAVFDGSTHLTMADMSLFLPPIKR
jgi:hypothetical protein